MDNENKPIERSAAHKNLLLNLLNTKGTNEIKRFFDKKIIFNNSKPTELLKKFISYTKLDDNDIILDFFAGSSTTAHAVLNINETKNTNLKFICVQIPENLPKRSAAKKAGYETLSELSFTRVCKVIEKMDNDAGVQFLRIVRDSDAKNTD